MYMHKGDSSPLSLLAIINIKLGNLCLFEAGVKGGVFIALILNLDYS